MRAAYFDRQGAASEVLTVGELPDPEPAAGEVRVKVTVSGLNPSDVKTRTGFAGVPMPFPRIIPHQDGAGIIDKVGPGVSEQRIGERVWLYKAQAGRPFGSAADYVALPADCAVPLPANASFEVGASLGIAAITAHRCLFAEGDIRGRRVLVHGGGGAVGTAAILLAKWAGAWVATTISRPEQQKVAEEAGADLVINRRSEDVAGRIGEATHGGGVDRIVDVDLVANIDTDLACLAPSGVVSAYATEDPSARLSVPFLKAMRGGFAIRFVYFYSLPDEAMRLAVRDVTASVASGAYRPVIGLVVPLDRIAESHIAQETGKIVGKILVKVEP